MSTDASIESPGQVTDGGHTIAGNALLGYAGSVSLTALRFATRVVLIRSLVSADFGRVITTQNLQTIVLAVSGLGIGDAVVRFVGLHAQDRARRADSVVLTASRFAILSGALATVLLLASSRGVAAWLGLGPQGRHGVTLAAFAIVPNLLGDVIGSGFRGWNRLWVKVIVLDLSRGSITLAGYVLMASIGWATYTGALSVQLVAALVSAGVMVVIFQRVRSFAKPDRQVDLSDLLVYSVPLFISGLVGGTLVGSGIPLMLAARNAPEMVAVYAMALTIQPLLQLPAIAIENAALPVWAAASGTHTERQLMLSFAHVTRWALILALLAFVPLSIAPRECLQALFGDKQLGPMAVVEVALATTLFTVAVGPNEGMLRALGSTRGLVVSRLVAGPLAFTAAWPLIRGWGVMGAIVAWAVNDVVCNAVSGLYLVRLHGIQPVDSRYLRTLIVGAIAWFTSAAAVAATDLDGVTKVAAIIGTNTSIFAILGFLVGVWYPAELTALVRKSQSR